ncbi:MAG TPA: transglycosylase SLT domain-containing protein [Vicinamibacteria bacterium]|nr:transglycosylase SLT domain-containing protein [Vicinamibacteria bacterium]
MDRRLNRGRLGIFLAIALVFLLLGFVSPPRAAREPAESASTAKTSLPWEPLSHPDDGLREVKVIMRNGLARASLEELSRVRESGATATARGLASFASGLVLAGEGRTTDAIRYFRAPEVDSTELGGYALFEIARLSETTDADGALQALARLTEEYKDTVRDGQARLAMAQLLEARKDVAGAIAVLEPASSSRDEELRGDALYALGRLHFERDRPVDAVEVLEKLYYGMPTHPRASTAVSLLTSARKALPEPSPAHYYRLGLKRAEAFLEERRYSDAYSAFRSVLSRYSGVADSDLLFLRMGVCQYRRRQLTASLTDFRKVRREELLPESLYYQAEVARRLGSSSTHLELVNRLIENYPASAWTEEAIYSLASHQDTSGEREISLSYFTKLVQMFPSGKRSLDAKWQLFWDDFRHGRFDEAGLGLEEAAREKPGAEGLARILYWSGRSFQEAGRVDRAESLYRQVLLGYKNTYYGRRALERLGELRGDSFSLSAIESARDGIDLRDALSIDRVAKQQRIAQLDVVGLDEAALAEARSAVRGLRDDAAFLALAAWIHHDRGRNMEAIRTIREAFPFHESATGDLLPRPIWLLFYPLDYWDEVQKYSSQHELDPFLVAALIRQESTFNPRVRSRAGARGLMQILPATGRVLARQERRKYALADLYVPEINIRYGTRYLKQELARFDERVDYALASYNAGPNRVRRWTGMDMSLDAEVFIEEIPFDETRNYVRLVLRNEMLYRRLYGGSDSEAAADE